jgi:hypothetical protein
MESLLRVKILVPTSSFVIKKMREKITLKKKFRLKITILSLKGLDSFGIPIENLNFSGHVINIFSEAKAALDYDIHQNEEYPPKDLETWSKTETTKIRKERWRKGSNNMKGRKIEHE